MRLEARKETEGLVYLKVCLSRGLNSFPYTGEWLNEP